MKELSMTSGSTFEKTLLPKGTHEARILRIIELGLKLPRKDTYNKGPQKKVAIVFEIPDYTVNINGRDLPVVKYVEYTLAQGEKANMTKLALAAGLEPAPDGSYKIGDLIGRPVAITVVHENGYDNIKTVSALTLKAAALVPPLVAESYYFDYDEPDTAILALMTEKTRDKLKEALNYKGSKLEALLDMDPPKLEEQV